MKKSVLGKGLSALIPDTYKENIEADKTIEKIHENVSDASKGMQMIEIAEIGPNHDQPRLDFGEERLQELADSIREQGIIQPVIVKKGAQNKYEIICGERRWRAAQRLGLSAIPAIVKDIANEDALELALVENIQRDDLNPVEEAEAYFKLCERGCTHEDVAKKVGKNRTTVVNLMRLLKLPKDILNLISDGLLTEGHARTLLSLPTPEYQKKLAKRIIEEQLSVRQVEEIVKRKAYKKRPAKRLRNIDAQILDLERKIEERVGSKVRIFAGKNKGRIEIRYFSLDELDRILNALNVKID